MLRFAPHALAAALLAAAPQWARPAERVVDVPTRPGVTVRVLVVTPAEAPRATVLLFTGGDGSLRLATDGSMARGKKNFLVRSRGRFAAQGLAAVVLDAPSDREVLDSFRSSREHAADIGAVVAWARRELAVPVWLVGTSRGTISAANAAVALGGPPGGPEGLVLTSTVLDDPRSTAVMDLDLDRVRVPVLVVHHRDDGCPVCPPSVLPRLERKLSHASRREVVVLTGGRTEGHPCEALAHHGFNGIEDEVVGTIARFVLASGGAGEATQRAR